MRPRHPAQGRSNPADQRTLIPPVLGQLAEHGAYLGLPRSKLGVKCLGLPRATVDLSRFTTHYSIPPTADAIPKWYNVFYPMLEFVNENRAVG